MLRIIVDSSATLTRDEAQRLGATVIPMTYVLDGVEVAETYMDENPDIAALLKEKRISATTGVGVQPFRQAFDEALENGDDVLCITISSKLSGTYRHAVEAAQASRAAHEGNGRIEVVDSLSGISGMEMLIDSARAHERCGLGFAQIVDAVRSDVQREGICFTVLSTDSLRDTGRLALVPQSVGSLLNRYPVLILEGGHIRHVATVRGTTATAQRMASCIPPERTHELVITNYGATGAINVALAHAIHEAFPDARLRVKTGGPVLSFILGSGAVSITWGPSTN